MRARVQDEAKLAAPVLLVPVHDRHRPDEPIVGRLRDGPLEQAPVLEAGHHAPVVRLRGLEVGEGTMAPVLERLGVAEEVEQIGHVARFRLAQADAVALEDGEAAGEGVVGGLGLGAASVHGGSGGSVQGSRFARWALPGKPNFAPRLGLEAETVAVRSPVRPTSRTQPTNHSTSRAHPAFLIAAALTLYFCFSSS